MVNKSQDMEFKMDTTMTLIPFSAYNADLDAALEN